MNSLKLFEFTKASVKLIAISLLFSSYAHSDWYYYFLKIECSKTQLRIVDYSTYSEEVGDHQNEPGVIDIHDLSTWRLNEEDIMVPDKERPHVETCKIPAGSYEIALTSNGGKWSAPFPIINVREITNPLKPESLIHNLHLEDSYNYKKYEIVFSNEHPNGGIIKEKICQECQ